MRILELSYEFPPLGGGGSMFTKDLLLRLAEMGDKVDVITMRAAGLPAFERPHKRMRIFRVYAARRDYNRCSFGQALLYLITGGVLVLRMLVAGERYDCIHATFIFPSGVLAWCCRWLFRAPYVLTASGSDVPGHNRSFDFWFTLLGPFWRLVVRQAAAVTAVSFYLRNLILRQVHRRVRVVPNGISASDFPQTSYGRKIITVGRLQQFKGFEYIFQALRGLDLRGYQLVVAGGGPDRRRLESLARRMEVPVLFTGRLSREVLLRHYAQSSILISASLFESFAGVVMEAMACGLAVIATRVGGCPEVVGEAGILVEKGKAEAIRKALSSLLGDERRIRLLGERARRRVREKFELRMVARQFQQVLAEAARL